MDVLIGLTQPVGLGNVLSLNLQWNAYLQIFEPIIDLSSYAALTAETSTMPQPIDRRTLQTQPSLAIIEMCSTYFGATMVGMANMCEIRAILNGTAQPKKTIRDTHDDDTDAGIPVLQPV